MSSRIRDWLASWFSPTKQDKTDEKPLSVSEYIKQLRHNGQQQIDFVEQSLQTEDERTSQKVILYFASLADSEVVRTHIIEPLQKAQLPQSTFQRTRSVSEMQDGLNKGCVIVYVEGEDETMVIQAPRNLARSIGEPMNEYVTRGPRDGLTEDLQLNLGLVRKRIKGADVQAKSFTIGKRTRTCCVLLYVSDLALPELVDEVSQKLQAIDTDAIFDTGQLEELLESHPLSPFDEFLNTERPDKIAADLLEGRIAILVENSPTAIIGPATFMNTLSTTDDYYQRFIPATMHRLLRLGGFFISAHLSAFYLSLVSYHSHLIPMKLVEILLSKRELVPFPPLFEILLMQVMIDLVLEAILRLPSKLGQIIGVSGAIVIGQAAVSANLISPGVIIVVSITTITGYVTPRLSTSFTLQILRYCNLFMSSVMGGYGLMVSMMFWVIYLCNFHSLGKAYLSPFSPFKWQDIRDTIVRLPKWLMQGQPDNPGAKQPDK